MRYLLSTYSYSSLQHSCILRVGISECMYARSYTQTIKTRDYTETFIHQFHRLPKAEVEKTRSNSVGILHHSKFAKIEKTSLPIFSKKKNRLKKSRSYFFFSMGVFYNAYPQIHVIIPTYYIIMSDTDYTVQYFLKSI